MSRNWEDRLIDKVIADATRKRRAAGMGWANWYINRRRLPLNPSAKQLRQLSWRRAI